MARKARRTMPPAPATLDYDLDAAAAMIAALAAVDPSRTVDTLAVVMKTVIEGRLDLFRIAMKAAEEDRRR